MQCRYIGCERFLIFRPIPQPLPCSQGRGVQSDMQSTIIRNICILFKCLITHQELFISQKTRIFFHEE